MRLWKTVGDFLKIETRFSGEKTIFAQLRNSDK